MKLLGGPGKAQGNVVEIWGGLGTQPAHDRHNGFHEFTDKEPGIKNLLDQQSADWKQDQAYNVMATALRRPTRRSTWSTATTTRWPTAPTSPPRMPAARRRSSSSASTRCPNEGVRLGQQRRADGDLPLRHAGRGGPAAGGQAAERREDRKADHAADDGRDEGERGGHPEAERADVEAVGGRPHTAAAGRCLGKGACKQTRAPEPPFGRLFSAPSVRTRATCESGSPSARWRCSARSHATRQNRQRCRSTG